MSRTRVLDLAKELGIETKVAIFKLQELGIQVKNHFNAVSEVEAAKLRALHRSGKTADGGAPAKPANKLIIRRKVETASEDIAQDEKETVQTQQNASETDKKAAAFESVSAIEPKKETFPKEETKLSKETAQETKLETPVAATPKVVVEPKIAEVTASKVTEKSVASENEKTAISTAETSLKKGHSEIPKVAQDVVSFKETTQKPVTYSQGAPIQTQSSNQNKMTTPKQTVTTPVNQSAPQPMAKPSSTGAVIVRKAETSPAPQSNNNMGQRRPGFGNQSQNGYQPRGNSNFNREGGQHPRGGYNNQQSYRQNNEGSGGNTGYRQNSEGGYKRNNEPGNSYQGGPGGQRPQGGYNSAAPGARGNYNAGTQGGRPPFAGSKPFVMAEAPAVGPASKDLPSRIKYTDKDREKRRSNDDTDFNKNAKANVRGKGRFEENLIDEDLIDLDLNTDGEGDAQIVRTMIPNRKKTSAFKRKEHKKAEPANPTKASKKILRIDGTISVNDLASELSQKATAVIKTLMKLGMMASINQQLDYDTANFVAQEFGFETQNASVSIGDILAQKTNKNDETAKENRPPIVTIMGHVDHGKTSLLDAIRSTKVAAKEAGGITQHIGAYQIDFKGQPITFLDTPGHEAFTAMRARGAKVTDLVVLVVAADDGVMPQTIEAISHAKAAGVPIVVAINKIDKPGINLERITRELSEQGVLPEEWGGDSMFVQVSAKTHQGLDNLLESILLLSEVLDLKASKDGLAEGIVIEAKLDKARGPLATVIVTSGTLKQQDNIVVGKCMGRVRALTNDHGERISEAGPAMPVEIIGLDGVPEAGDQFNCVASDAIAKEAVAFRIEKQRQKDLANQRGSTMEELLAQMAGSTEEKPKELAIIIKADTHGSAEAIKSSIQKLDTAKVKTRVIHSAVGGITETDAILAQASNAMIVGFNVRPDRMASQFAERSGVSIQCFSIIYQLTEAVQAAMLGTLAPVKQDKVLGHAEVRTTFSVPKVGVVAGTMVMDGKITRNSHIRVVRDGVVIYTGRVGSLKRFKDDAKEVASGFECGINVENYNDIKIGDVLEAFIVEEIAATLE